MIAPPVNLLKRRLLRLCEHESHTRISRTGSRPLAAGVYSPLHTLSAESGPPFEDADARAPLFGDGLHENNVRLKLRTFKCRDGTSRLVPRR
jgi:hypothetical protein